MTSLEYYIEQVEQFISMLTDDIESGEGTVVTQTKLAVYREVLEHLEEIEQEPCGDAMIAEKLRDLSHWTTDDGQDLVMVADVLELIREELEAMRQEIEQAKIGCEQQMRPATPEERQGEKEYIDNTQPSGDLISREETLTAFADYVGSGMSMNDYDALWDIVAKMPAVKQEPKFIAKSDGTIEQIKNCNDCLFKKEWEKIGKLLSNILEKHTEQEPCEDAISRQSTIFLANDLKQDLPDDAHLADMVMAHNEGVLEYQTQLSLLPPVNPQSKTGHWIETAEEYYKAVNEYGGGVNEDTPYFVDDIACSVCLAMYSVIDNETERFDHCPSCGAKMAEPQERSDEE